MIASLNSLVNSSPTAAFKNTRNVLGRGAFDPELYRVIPAESENGRKITLREVIDRRKLEYIVSHREYFELGSRLIKGKKLDKNAHLTLIQGYLAQECPTYIAILVLSRQWYQLRRARRLYCDEYMTDKMVYTGNVWD